MYATVNPATGETLQRYPPADETRIELALERAWHAFGEWRTRSFRQRARPMLRAAELLEAQAAELARWMATEMGKPLAQGEAEARKCAWGCRYFAEHAEAMLQNERRDSDADESHVRFDPLGPILAIMPWNFPFWQFYRFAAPALMAGNVVLLKHAPNTPGCAERIERLMLEAGFPEGVVQNLFLTNAQASRVIADPRVRGVTLTGSTRAGSEVGEIAGRHRKPIVLELGGSDPFIVFADADLDEAVHAGVESRCQNSGQSCIAAKRFLVERGVYETFRGRFVEAMTAKQVGDPLDPRTEIGPLARADLRDRLAEQVRRCLEAGARLAGQGRAPGGPGFYYPPLVLEGAPQGSPAACEELFGPVAVLEVFADEAEAVRLANSTPYGLGASLWTRDEKRVARLVPRIEAGSIFVNGMVKSDPRLPFGGVKDSGYGRELGREGIREFVDVKTVWIRRCG